MVQSVIISMVTENPYNWIFCEGSSDKIYLEHYLSSEIKLKNLRIVPLGGYKQVAKLYGYLTSPLSDKDIIYKGKVICLIDTDSQQKEVKVDNNCPHIKFKKIVLDKSDKKVKLENLSSDLNHETVIEDTLSPEPFESLIKDKNSKNQVIGFDILFDIVSKTSKVKSSENLYSYLDLSPSMRDRIFKEFFSLNNNENKVNFARCYISHDPNKDYEPTWIKELRSLI